MFLVFALGNEYFNSEPIKIDKYVNTFSSRVIWLMLGGFFLASAMTKTKLDQTLFKFTLKLSGNSPRNLLIGLMFSTMVVSTVMSNTATTAMFVASISPLLASLGKKNQLSKVLLIGIAIGATTGEWSLVALAGPANRQGRIAADVMCGRDSKFRGTQGTAVLGIFDATVAWTGVNEKTLKRIGDTDYEKIYLYPNSHAGYYPGAKPIAMKVIFRKSDGTLLGVQALGLDGVDKRVSVMAGMMQMGATIYDLEEAELCYAPQFGSAKDPVNFAGMVAADVLRNDMPVSHWKEAKDGFILDVREPFELAVESIPGATNIPIAQLRSRLEELPKDKEINVICRSGQRAYYATRILLQNGFKVKNVSGGMISYAHNFLFEADLTGREV